MNTILQNTTSGLTNEKSVVLSLNSQAYRASPITVHGIERIWVNLKVRITILYIAIRCYRSPGKALKAAKGIQSLVKAIYGSNKLRRAVKVDGKYYFGIYQPSFPSPLFDLFIQTELNKILPHGMKVNRFQTIQLAFTNKCPLHCEHCFEWNNLNREEPFTPDELKVLISRMQQPGCTLIHFTGGEPLVRMQILEDLIRHAVKASECWVLTSGMNLTPENAKRLKTAGATGVVISLDHYDAHIHNHFRGSDQAFDSAMKAAKNARQVKLVTAFSICMTRSFVTEENLLQYARLAKDCGVAFVQLLEPKAVGHYEGKDVSLSKEQCNFLDDFFIKINFGEEFKNYPMFNYHGYYQRKNGCMSAGNWSLYIDSAGHIDACPFCHTKQYSARDIISGKMQAEQLQMTGCPAYADFLLAPHKKEIETVSW
jgi:MoaA/NifB/PqqE/SkfB family radical SAM enzyme